MERRGSTKIAVSLHDVRSTFEQQRLLSMKDTLMIIHEAQDLMNAEPNMVVVLGASTYVFGDIHGQFYDLMRIIDDVGLEHIAANDVKLVFLGDYVDRGAFSSEVVLYLLLLKVSFPTKVVLLRGNHECETISSFYGFRTECQQKYGISVYYHFLSCFQSLPIAALVKTPRGDIFCVHGGISPDVASIHAIASIDRHRELPADGALCDLLWSDPAVATSDPTAADSKWTANEVRGCSYYFSPSATFEFLAQNHLLAVVRAHEYAELGFMFHFTSSGFDALDTRADKVLPPLITVFSAANYCDQHGNLAGYLIFHSDPFAWEIKQLEAVAHPAPLLPGAGRASDIWKQFTQTLPFLPASKNFFDDIVALAAAGSTTVFPPHSARDDHAAHGKTKPSLAKMESVGRDDPFASIEDPSERRRRQTSEMHPQAISRVLDAEASKWIQSDDGTFEVFPPESSSNSSSSAAARAPIARRMSLPAKQLSLEDRSKILSPTELETIKLIFSLMDTDGNMVLSAPEVTTFILNVLGERISRPQAETYLDALDFDQDGVVDFADILSWAAVMKMNYEPPELSPVTQLVRSALQSLKHTSVHHLFALLLVGAVATDLFTRREHLVVKSKALRICSYLGVLLYVVKLTHGGAVSEWTSVVRVYTALSDLKRKLLRQ